MRKSIGWLAVFSVALLVGCSSSVDGGLSEGDAFPPLVVPPEPSVPPSAQQRIDAALENGDPATLADEDADDLLALAIYEAGKLQNQQMTALRNIFISDVSQQLDFTTNSLNISPRQATVAFPYLVADNGNVLASASMQEQGRAIAYGRDVLEHIEGSNQAHKPLLNRGVNWLVHNDASQEITQLKYAIVGYDNNRFSKYLTSRDIKFEKLTCDLNNTKNTCWQNAELLVFGYSTQASPEREAQIKQYQQAGANILYIHASWTDSAGGRQVVHGLGMEMGGYPGNYFQGENGVKINKARTVAETLKRTNQFGDLYDTLNMLADTDLQHDFKADPMPTNTISKYMNELGNLQSGGVALFSADYTEIYRLLVLWADLWRTQVVYNQPQMRITGDANTFLRAYASDSFLYFPRQHTKVNPQGAGDYMPKINQPMQPNGTEIVEVTIAQKDGFTAIGRGAIAGGAVQIEVEDGADINYLGVQTSYVRTFGNPLTDKYERPRRPHSFTIPLKTSGVTHFVTPFGGPLFLRYTGAKAGVTVKLKITGAVNYSHFDFTRKMSDDEMAAAVDALQQGEFGWQTLKFVGGEIQQTLKYAKSAMGNRDPQDYVVGDLQNQLFKSNHIAMGFNNETMSSAGQTTCSTLGWDCTGNTHNAPSVQHFIGWLAACGFLCSGNPSDGAAGLAVGWGWAHELGHNTVQRIFNIQSCVVECDNNVLAAATMLRLYATLNKNEDPRLNYADLHAKLSEGLATGKIGTDLQKDMNGRMWYGQGVDQNTYRGVFFELSFLYSKHRLNMTKPDITSTLEFLGLLNIGTRLVDRNLGKNPSESDLDKYAMRGFAGGGKDNISNEDLLYVLSSKIIGKDLMDIFTMYGLPVSAQAQQAVEALNLSKAAREFYVVPNKGNDIAGGQWLAITGNTLPDWPVGF